MAQADIQKVISIALAEVGYLEKQSNKDLDDFTANAGNRNYTKYARDIDNISGYFNGKKQGYEWCATVLNWCFIKAFGADMAHQLLCQPSKSLAASCTRAASYFQQQGQFIRGNPQAGDQIFFGTPDSCYHTGLVVAVDGSMVYTVEGNTTAGSAVVSNGGAVCKKTYLKTSGAIAGYGRPRWELLHSGSVPEEPSNPSVSASTGATIHSSTTDVNTCLVELNELEMGQMSYQVKVMQTALIHHGYSVGIDGADGEFGNNTQDGLKKFQSEHALDADGVCGKLTWKALLND